MYLHHKNRTDIWCQWFVLVLLVHAYKTWSLFHFQQPDMLNTTIQIYVTCDSLNVLMIFVGSLISSPLSECIGR